MKLRVVVPARAVLEHRAHDVGRHHPGPAAFLNPRPGAIAQHCLLKGYPSRIVMRPLDAGPQSGVRYGPQGRDALVRAEGHVETRRAPLAAGVARQPFSTGRAEAVIEPVEITAIDLAAVGKSEHPLRVEPDAIRFFARGVVLVGMAEGTLAFQVIRCRGRLREGRYHGQARRSLPNSTRPGETILLLSKSRSRHLATAGRSNRPAVMFSTC